jgi:stage II sporulation protein AA (anti-sigma F factor antagonist)
VSDPLASVDVGRAAGGVRVVTVRGEIDLTNADAFADALAGAAEGVTELRVDLSAVVYLDSLGARVLHRLAVRHQLDGLRVVVLVAPHGVVHDVVRLTRLGDVVSVREQAP